MILTMPLYVFDDLDVCIFETIAALNAYLEEQDVTRGVYQCFDAEGYCVDLRLVGTKQNAIITPVKDHPCTGEFTAALKRTLTTLRISLEENVSIQSLRDIRDIAERVLDVYS